MAENSTTKQTSVDLTSLAAIAALMNKGNQSEYQNIPASEPYYLHRLAEGEQAPNLPGAGPAPAGFAYYENPGYVKALVDKATAEGAKITEVDGRLIRTDAQGISAQVWPLNNAAPPAKPVPASQMGQVVGGRLYVPDPNDPTKWNPVTPEGPDDQKKIADIAEREKNKTLTGRYMTDIESLDYQAKVNNLGYDAQKAALFPGQVAQQGATLAGTQASTAGTQASTAQTLQNIDIAKAKLPGDLAQAAATLAGTQASTAATQQATQIAGAPQVQAPQTGMYTWQKDPKTGEIKQTGINVEYQAKTQADVLARIGQMHSLMQQKSDEVQAKVDAKTISPEQGLAEFNQWYDRNITPQAGQLQAAQQAAQFKQAQDEAVMRQNAYTSALSAGSQARENWTANNVNRVGPGWQAASEAAGRGDFKAMSAVPNSVTYRAPDVNQVATNAVNEALKYLSPSAAAATGTPLPNFQNVDITQQLSPVPYVSRFGPGAPVGTGAPPPPPPMGPVAPPNQVPGQNYGAGTAYTGGVAPWNFTPDMLGTFQYGGV